MSSQASLKPLAASHPPLDLAEPAATWSDACPALDVEAPDGRFRAPLRLVTPWPLVPRAVPAEVQPVGVEVPEVPAWVG